MNTNTFNHFYNSSGICTDTRTIKANSLFICIKGGNFDGNTFASNALKNGASHVILDNREFYVDNGKMTLVDDSIEYLQKLANFHRKKFNIPVIGITGSNGKTTTKELIHTVLSKKYNVLATKGNLNNHLGVPFTLLNLTNRHEIAIIEMGANKLMDIEELCEIAEPTHGIITNIGRAHLEGFGDFNGVIKTKKELYGAIEKNNGTLFVNQDDELLKKIAPTSISTHFYGTKNADVIGELISLSPFVNMKWATEKHQSEIIATQMVGKYNFYNYLAAVSIGVAFKVPENDISNAISEYAPTNNRSQIKETSKNTLILDCYNANPTSMKSALESFAMIDRANKLCILGDMKELGIESQLEHEKIIQLISSLNIDAILVGQEFGKMKSPSILNQFETTKEMQEYITSTPIEDHLILIKGSRSIGLEVLENNL